MATVDVLIPTCDRPAAQTIVLASLSAQTVRDFRVVISDQGERTDAAHAEEVQALLRMLRLHGHAVELHKHLPRRGRAEQRAFLLSRARAPYALFFDDDVMFEPDVLARMVRADEGNAVLAMTDPCATLDGGERC